MEFIDFFAGIGGFRRGLELAWHKCVGFCEFDKYAVASYTSMHLITDEQYKKLELMPKGKRAKEILKEEYRNGEWYANDVREVKGKDLPMADLWCAGFPCQDISVAGSQLGFDGNRSSLFFQIIRLVEERENSSRPTWLLFENVKNLLGVNKGWDFARVLIALDEIGYDTKWCVLNSKDFGVPQNRERVFIVATKRGGSGVFEFPQGVHNDVRIYDILDSVVDKKYYMTECATRNFQLFQKQKGDEIITVGSLNPSKNVQDRVRVLGIHGISQSLRATDYKDPVKVLVGDVQNIAIIEDFYKGRGDRVYTEYSPTLRSERNGLKVAYTDGVDGVETKIRKVTPKESFRLQGWSDEYFKGAEFVCSDTQLYKQAGNGVTVDVIREIGNSINKAVNSSHI